MTDKTLDAAATELLQACIWAAEIIKDSWGDEQMERGDCQAYNILKAAIAKAEGR